MIVIPITTHDSEGAKLHIIPGQEYEVLSVEGGYYRVLTDPESQPYGNDPVLYEASCFSVKDHEQPTFWVSETREGESYQGPFVWSRYFFEDFHDGNEKARKQFEWQLKKYYPKTWQERHSFVRPG
jgi:hypothetical protein